MIFGIVIMIFLMRSSRSFSFSSNSARWSEAAVTCFLTSSASSFLPCPINAPICLEILFLLARRSSASFFTFLFSSSSSITSSTNGSFASWNLFRIFCFTISGFSLTNLKSNMSFSPYCRVKTRFGKNISYFAEKRKGISPTFLSVYQSSQNKPRSREGSAPHRRLLCTLLRILLPGSPPPGGTSRLITRPPQQRKIHLRFPDALHRRTLSG